MSLPTDLSARFADRRSLTVTAMRLSPEVRPRQERDLDAAFRLKGRPHRRGSDPVGRDPGRPRRDLRHLRLGRGRQVRAGAHMLDLRLPARGQGSSPLPFRLPGDLGRGHDGQELRPALGPGGEGGEKVQDLQ